MRHGQNRYPQKECARPTIAARTRVRRERRSSPRRCCSRRTAVDRGGCARLKQPIALRHGAFLQTRRARDPGETSLFAEGSWRRTRMRRVLFPLKPAKPPLERERSRASPEAQEPRQLLFCLCVRFVKPASCDRRLRIFAFSPTGRAIEKVLHPQLQRQELPDLHCPILA